MIRGRYHNAPHLNQAPKENFMRSVYLIATLLVFVGVITFISISAISGKPFSDTLAMVIIAVISFGLGYTVRGLNSRAGRKEK